MKIIRSIPALIVCLCTTTLLHAQQTKNENNKPLQLKAEVLKDAEIKPPSQALRSNIPSPQPELKPQLADEKPVAAETPKSFVSEEEVRQQEKAKPAMKVADAGKAETPKLGPTTPNTLDKNPKVVPATKSTASQQQQNQ